MFARLRPHHADEAGSATLACIAAAVSLQPATRWTACRAKSLRVAALTEGMVDERKATLTDRASRRDRERIALVDLDRRADVRTARVDVHVEAGISRLGRPAAPRASDGISPARTPGAARVAAATRASATVWAYFSGAPALKQ